MVPELAARRAVLLDIMTPQIIAKRAPVAKRPGEARWFDTVMGRVKGERERAI